MQSTIDTLPPLSSRLLPRRPRHRALAVVAAVLLLVAGGIIGSGVTILYFRSRAVPRGETPEAVCAMITARLSGSVPLDREELDRIQAVVSGNIGKVGQLKEEYSDEVRSQLVEMCDRICEILGPERASACAHMLLQGEESNHGELF